tara:strand:+ start:878 stop:1813 length:936 start_codon:yes stop_codon:yes gene_type:complete
MAAVERILKLLAELLNAESPRTAEELKIGVNNLSDMQMYPDDLVAFRRAFNRDKAALKEMGVPIDVIPVDGSAREVEAYYVDNKDYYLPDLELSDEELIALNYAANSVHLTDGLTEDEAIRKLGGYLGSDQGLSITEYADANSTLPELFNAISNRSPITFTYNDKPRTLNPYLLQFEGEKWYLTGYELEDEKLKSFRLDRIEALNFSEETEGYEIPENVKGANLLPFSYGDDQEIKARVQIDNAYVPWVEQNLDTEVNDGIANFMVANYDSFIDRVLMLLDHAEIISPQILRERLIIRLEKMRDRTEDVDA